MPISTRGPFGLLRLSAIAAIAVSAIALAFHLDGATRDAILAAQPKGWKNTAPAQIARALGKYGDWPELMGLGAVALAISIGARTRRWSRIVATAMIASTLAGIVANSMRLTTGRPRPRESPAIEQGFYGMRHEGRWIIGDPAYNSFPSGHTATAVGFAAAILIASPWWGLPAMVLALSIAWSRMAVGAHHLSDVVVSICIGVAMGYLVSRLIESRWDRWVNYWCHGRATASPPE